jgi:hypothetical protein
MPRVFTRIDTATFGFVCLADYQLAHQTKLLLASGDWEERAVEDPSLQTWLLTLLTGAAAVCLHRLVEHMVLQMLESAPREHTKARALPKKCCRAAAFPDRNPRARSAQPKTFGYGSTLARRLHSSDRSNG